MILPIDNLDTLKEKNATEAVFSFTDSEELRKGLIMASEDLTNKRYEISLLPKDANTYKLEVMPGNDGFSHVLNENIRIKSNFMSMRICVDNNKIPVMTDLAEKFMDYVKKNYN